MTAAIANALRPVDGLNVRVLVDNVTDSLSTVPQGVMQIAFANIGAIVLSHGHWDHAGGLVEAINIDRE
jgi:metal-dependent hydrolase (beta-lactamase superfamily II)